MKRGRAPVFRASLRVIREEGEGGGGVRMEESHGMLSNVMPYHRLTCQPTSLQSSHPALELDLE